jgi:hypothetical protein
MCNILSREAGKKKAAIFAGPLFETICKKLFRRRSRAAGVLFGFFSTFVMAFMLLSALSGIG